MIDYDELDGIVGCYCTLFIRIEDIQRVRLLPITDKR